MTQPGAAVKARGPYGVTCSAEYIGRMSLCLPTPASLLGHLASQCAVCRSWPSPQVCAACLRRFAGMRPRCRSCALELPADLSLGRGTPSTQCPACLTHPAVLDHCFAALPYAYPWSQLIAQYKYTSRTGWAPFFARLLLQLPGTAELLAGLDTADWLLPMPLAAERLESRGFNQAWELACALHRLSGSRAARDASVLLRLRHTRAQSQLKRRERLDNVKGAFAVDPLRLALVQGRHVVLVDDVMTSGASLFTAARALRAAGARQVSALVVARTEH